MMRRSRAARMAMGALRGFGGSRFGRRSSTCTAIELSEEELMVRNRVLAEIERSHLFSLAAEETAEEQVGQDFPDVNQKLEELQTIEAIENLSAIYKSQWNEAVVQKAVEEPQPSKTKMSNGTSQLLKKISNVEKRIESEHFQTLNLLDKLHARRTGIEEERNQLNLLISKSMQITQEKASSREHLSQK